MNLPLCALRFSPALRLRFAAGAGIDSSELRMSLNGVCIMIAIEQD
jgi:hypothetical protein